MTFSRRSALSSLLLPAIIRTPGLIMPISPQHTFRLGGTSFAQITEEFARLLRIAAQRKNLDAYAAKTDGAKQFHVDMEYNRWMSQMSIQQISDRMLLPAVCNLVAALPRNAKLVGQPLAIPPNLMQGAVTATRGVGVRAVQDYDIQTDLVITRFDILTT